MAPQTQLTWTMLNNANKILVKKYRSMARYTTSLHHDSKEMCHQLTRMDKPQKVI